MDARYLNGADTAKLIRVELKKNFPATKFSVRTERSGTIRINWTDGPTQKRVDEVVGGFEGKGFDGMIDMGYTIYAWVLNGEVIGTRSTGTAGSMGSVPAWGIIPPHDDAELVHFGSGFIFTNRTISPTLANKCIAQVAAYWGGVEVAPIAVAGYFGHDLQPAIGNNPVRADLGGFHHDWHSSIRRAAENRTEFAREV